MSDSLTQPAGMPAEPTQAQRFGRARSARSAESADGHHRTPCRGCGIDLTRKPRAGRYPTYGEDVRGAGARSGRYEGAGVTNAFALATAPYHAALGLAWRSKVSGSTLWSPNLGRNPWDHS